MPIATRISKTSNFFTADLLVDGRCPDAIGTVRPVPEVNGVWWPPSSSKRVGRVIPVRWVRFLPPPHIGSEREELEMGRAVSEVLPFAIGVAISPVLFSQGLRGLTA